MESDCECCGESANNYYFGMCIACIKTLPAITAERDALKKDALRYRFLRDADNWGEDSGDDCWGILAESTMCNFDDIVDARMSRTLPPIDKEIQS